MKKFTFGQILMIGAVAVGAVAIGKVIYDINKIRKLTAEKEAELTNENALVTDGEPQSAE